MLLLSVQIQHRNSVGMDVPKPKPEQDSIERAQGHKLGKLGGADKSEAGKGRSSLRKVWQTDHGQGRQHFQPMKPQQAAMPSLPQSPRNNSAQGSHRSLSHPSLSVCMWTWTHHLFCRAAIRISRDARLPGPEYVTGPQETGEFSRIGFLLPSTQQSLNCHPVWEGAFP